MITPARFFLRGLIGIWAALLSPLANGQSTLSARAGLIHHVEGKVVLVDPTPEQSGLTAISKFVHINRNQRLRVNQGRVEVLLSPGVFFRVGDDSLVEMVSTDLNDARVRFHEGSALVDLVKKSARDTTTLLCDEAVVRFEKKGVYRVDCEPGQPPRLRVFRGKALVSAHGRELEVPAKWSLALAGAPNALSLTKFDRSETDELDRWSRQRARLILEDEQARAAARRRGETVAATWPGSVLWGGRSPGCGGSSSGGGVYGGGSSGGGRTGGAVSTSAPRSSSGGGSAPRGRTSGGGRSR